MKYNIFLVKYKKFKDINNEIYNNINIFLLEMLQKDKLYNGIELYNKIIFIMKLKTINNY